MSQIWPHFTRESPCPACKHWDWACRFNGQTFVCMRVQSDRPCRSGGWYHQFDGKQLATVASSPRIPPPSINAARLIMEWAKDTTLEALGALADTLGVSPDSLASLGCVWAKAPHKAWAFPMRSGDGNAVGIRLRSMDGQKWAVRGSRSGIFLPEVEPQSVAYVPEGPTDTAAALTLGLFAIGRPSCNTGGPEIKAACRRLGVHRIVIVCDNDEGKRRPDGSPWNPGIEGAERVAKDIGLKHCFWVPPAKDLREFLRLGGTREMIESDLRGKKWDK